jgi:hypothetical protein
LSRCSSSRRPTRASGRRFAGSGRGNLKSDDLRESDERKFSAQS